MDVLLLAVKRQECEVKGPSETQMRASSASLQRNRDNGDLLEGVFAVTDGWRFPCADYTTQT